MSNGSQHLFHTLIHIEYHVYHKNVPHLLKYLKRHLLISENPISLIKIPP